MYVSMYYSYKTHYEMRYDPAAEVMIGHISVIKSLKVISITCLCRQNYLSSLKTIYDCELIYVIYHKYIIYIHNLFLMFVCLKIIFFVYVCVRTRTVANVSFTCQLAFATLANFCYLKLPVVASISVVS